MSTSAQIDANRLNATHSTGPTTDAGKAASSRNGLKHGLSTGQLIIPGESEEEFNEFLAALLDEHKPATLTETLTIQDMAKYQWLADRALDMQSTAMIMELRKNNLVPPTLGVLIRYHNAHKRAFEKAFATFRSMKKERLAQIGSASQQSPNAPPPETLITYTTPPPMEEILRLFSQGYDFNPMTRRYEPSKEV